MTTTAIRPAVAADYEAIRDLLQESDVYHASNMPAVHCPPDEPRYTRAEHDAITANEYCCVLVAERDGKVVGFVEASQCDSDLPDEVPGPWCGVHNLAVQCDYWRQGIGLALMRSVEEWAHQRGLDQLRLTVYEFNTGARALYECLGYRTYSRELLKSLRND